MASMLVMCRSRGGIVRSLLLTGHNMVLRLLLKLTRPFGLDVWTASVIQDGAVVFEVTRWSEAAARSEAQKWLTNRAVEAREAV